MLREYKMDDSPYSSAYSTGSVVGDLGFSVVIWSASAILAFIHRALSFDYVDLPTHAAPLSSYDEKRSGKLSFDFHDPKPGRVIDFGAEIEPLRLP
jgi:hypothetical protein